MILQELKKYYDRKSSDPDGGIAPEGFEYKEIPFVIVLDEQGQLVQIEDTRYQEGKWTRSKIFLVPQAEKRTVGVSANLLWDNAEYIFGIAIKGKLERVKHQHEAFINRVKSLNIEDAGVYAILKFLTNSPKSFLEESPYANEIKETNPFMAFRLHYDINLVSSREKVVQQISSIPVVGSQGFCLVSGENDVLANLQPSIKGVVNTNSTGGNLVSFNLDAFNSYNKKQGSNAQIGQKAAFAYTTALNHLLRKKSLQKIQVGDATTVFWSETKSQFEEDFSMFFNDSIDNPDALTDSVKTLFKAVQTGVLPNEKNQKFFVLGLSPNAARISVRFWYAQTIQEFAIAIFKHFSDLMIVHAPYQKEHLSMRELLSSIALLGKKENIPPNIAGDWMRCILSQLPYPDSLFQAVLRRIQADREVTYPRAAILKSYLNRKAKFQLLENKELTVSLDTENHNSGYRLGRLFATLEKIQEATGRDVKATIRDRYYSAASGTPASVMPILMRLKNHHLVQLPPSSKIFFEKLIGEILANLNDFPPQLTLQDQGRFAIGYYHQRQDFFIKSENTSKEI